MRNIALDVLAEQVSGVVVAEACNAVHAVQVVQLGRCVAGCSVFCNKAAGIVTIATLYPAVAVLSTVVLERRWYVREKTKSRPRNFGRLDKKQRFKFCYVWNLLHPNI